MARERGTAHTGRDTPASLTPALSSYESHDQREREKGGWHTLHLHGRALRPFEKLRTGKLRINKTGRGTVRTSARVLLGPLTGEVARAKVAELGRPAS